MFAAGLTIAMPVGFVLILVQIIMGVIGRSSPALNLFAVGIPATLLAGIVLLGIATPAMAEAIAHILSDALDAARMIAGICSMAEGSDKEQKTEPPTAKKLAT